MSGIAAVQSRIAGIQSRIAELGALTASPATTRSTAAAPSTSGLAGTAATVTPATALQTSSSTSVSSPGFSELLSSLVEGGRATGATTVRATAGGPTGDDVVSAAKEHLGVPYRWGGTDPATGFDCSGLVQHVFAGLGVDLPRVAKDQGTVGEPVRDLASARPGDLVVLDGGGHIGIYVGDGKMLHAPHRGDVVKISTVWETPTAIRRVVGTDAAAGAVPPVSALDASAARPSGIRSEVSAAVRRYEDLFAAATERYDLPAGLLAAVAQQESGGNPTAVSPAGARGLMQFMPATARGLGVDPMDPASAVDGAGRLLAQHLTRYDGSVPLALAAYNAGPGNVARYDGIPPFRETQQYVKKITAALGMVA